jgi:D-alanyl-D-alanine carboxypeptidase
MPRALILAQCSYLLLGCPAPLDDTAQAPIPFDEATALRLDTALQALVDELGAPGIQAAVSVPGHEPWLGWAGVSDLDSGTALAEGHAQPAGSVTKTVTAALMLDLVDQGLLGLDDPVAGWIEGFPWGQAVTVRHLLQHSSGIQEYFGLLESQGTLGESWTLEGLVAQVASTDLDFEPGSAWSYSNTNYVLLGLVAEAATGEPWTDSASALLGRAGSSARLPDDVGWGEVIPGYLLLASGEPYPLSDQTDMSLVVHPSSVGPAGMLVAEAGDLARWASACWVHHDVIPSGMVLQAMADPMSASDNMDYGLGVMSRQDQHGQEWFHNGALYGYVAWMGWRLEDGVSLALLSNAWLMESGTGITPYWSTDAADRLWDAYYQAP